MMAHSAMLFNFLVKHIKIIVYSTLQDNSLPFSPPHLAISVLVSFKPEVGHMTMKWAWLLIMSMYIIYSDPKCSSATIVELLEFTVDPVLSMIARFSTNIADNVRAPARLPFLSNAHDDWALQDQDCRYLILTVYELCN